jgi:leucyl-tRNA synthetase
MTKCGHLNLSEPFAGLLTQGMICHETYRDEDGTWLEPDEIERSEGGGLINPRTGKTVSVGRAEKMSKSRKNVVDPQAIIGEYGADTARLFMLSDSPPERDLDWTDAGIEGAWRYINRLWRMLDEANISLPAKEAPKPAKLCPDAEGVWRAVHRTINGVSGDLDAFHFNKAIARIRELTNQLEALGADAGSGAADEVEGDAWVYRAGLDAVVRMIGPMMPHLAEEMWRRLGYDTLLVDAPWPEADAALLAEETVTVGIQVNGKMRGTLELPADAAQEVAEKAALELENVVKAIGGKTIRKVVFVPNRIVNVVV